MDLKQSLDSGPHPRVTGADRVEVGGTLGCGSELQRVSEDLALVHGMTPQASMRRPEEKPPTVFKFFPFRASARLWHRSNRLRRWIVRCRAFGRLLAV